MSYFSGCQTQTQIQLPTQTQTQTRTQAAYHHPTMPMPTMNGNNNRQAHSTVPTTNNNNNNNNNVLANFQAGIRNNLTLELQVITTSMRPSDFKGTATPLLASQNDIFCKLPSDEAALLCLLESFTFTYRPRKHGEQGLAPNAALYYGRLAAHASPLLTQMDHVVGFRCCGCRDATLSPEKYRAGSAQLICMEYFNPLSSQRVIMELRNHVVSCTEVPEHLKLAVSQKTSSTSSSNKKGNMGEYITIWNKAFLTYAQKTGAPLCNYGPFHQPLYQVVQQQQQQQQHRHPRNQISTNGNQSKRGSSLGNSSNRNTLNNQNNGILGGGPEIGVLQAALRASRQQQLRPSLPQLMPGQQVEQNAQMPQPEPLDVEDEIQADLEGCISRCLFKNNFGLRQSRPRVIEADLTELPISSNKSVSPFLELLFQSFSAVLRWNTSTTSTLQAGEKRSVEEITESPVEDEQPAYSNVFFQCSYCHDHKNAFCVTTGTPEGAAKFLTESCVYHLTEACPNVPSTLVKKLNKLNGSCDEEQRDDHIRVVEDNFSGWKEQLQTFASKRVEKGTPAERSHILFWRPLSWKFMKESGGAIINDADLSYTGGSFPLQVHATDKLPYVARDDDVLIGWDGDHVGNRRFLNILAEFRETYFAESVSPMQQKVIAVAVVKCITSRGGKFYTVGTDFLTNPPKKLDPVHASTFVQQVLKRGYFVLLQPPSDPTKTERGSRVLEVEYGPQQNVFGKQIIRNKRFKRLVSDEKE